MRNAKSKTDEANRVAKELANIRAKFTNSQSLSSYQKKKYVWKLVYIFMLGYDVNFGHAEVVSLVGSAKYSEKQVRLFVYERKRSLSRHFPPQQP